MARRDPNKFEVKGNPSVWVTLHRHGREGESKDALWHYVFWRDGKRYRGSTGKLDHGEAVAVAREAVEKVINTTPHSAAPLTLSVAVEDYIATKWPTDQTANNRAYLDARNRLDSFMEYAQKETSLSTLDVKGATQLLQGFLDKRRKDGNGAQTLLNFRLVVSAFYAWLMQRERVSWARNPASKELLTLPTVERRAAPPLDVEKVKAAIEAARSNEAFPALILCLSGLRPRGASRVRWNDIDLKGQSLKVLEKGRERVIPLSDWAAKELQWWRDAHPADDAVISAHSTLYKRMRQLRKDAGLDSSVQLQAMRRTFLATLYRANVAPQLAARLAGNSIPTIQRHYVSLEAMDARPVVNVLNFGETASQSASPKKKKKSAS